MGSIVEEVSSMKGKSFLVIFFAGVLLMAVAPGCMAFGFSKGGTVVPIAEAAKEERAKAIVLFNEATALLEAEKVDEAIAAYKEVERLYPSDVETQKQLGIIYEFFKVDEETAYTYYKRYKELGGSEPEILAAVKEFGKKYGPVRCEMPGE